MCEKDINHQRWPPRYDTYATPTQIKVILNVRALLLLAKTTY